jgi:hypothetical protein
VTGVTDHSPALVAARRLARVSTTNLLPVDGRVPVDPNCAILLVDSVPSDVLLTELAAVLPSLQALVLWVPGWAESDAVLALRHYDLQHGSIDVLAHPEPGVLAVLAADEARAVANAEALRRRERSFRTLAVMPVFNEVDVIYHSVGALVAEGVDVYLIDHESTDGTAEAARPWLGRGLVHIERFPDDAGFPERNRHEMVWRELLRRVGEVTGEIDADWYMFVNADEFREAPWPGMVLADALSEVDELGYNAVDFEWFDFLPIDDGFRAGEDPRRHLLHFEAPDRWNVPQIKAWRRQAQVVDLVQHGGHDVSFDGKRVFPVPFILRHYPIRSSEHGRRKVRAERLPRFAAEERAEGWHVQYDHYKDDADYLRDPATLTAWDGAGVRAQLLARSLRELLLMLNTSATDPATGQVDARRISSWVSGRPETALGPTVVGAVQRRLEAWRAAGISPGSPCMQPRDNSPS